MHWLTTCFDSTPPFKFTISLNNMYTHMPWQQIFYAKFGQIVKIKKFKKYFLKKSPNFEIKNINSHIWALVLVW